jgi:hypothetical protein
MASKEDNSPSSPVTSEGEYRSLRDDHEALRLQFISIELDLAITFCQMASTAETTDKAERNAQNAWRAYQAASQRLETPATGLQSHPEIEEKLRRLEQLFLDLERIPRAKR